MIQGDSKDKELNMECSTRFSKENFLLFCRKVLGQVSPFPYEERPIPALLEVLEWGQPIPVLQKALG